MLFPTDTCSSLFEFPSLDSTWRLLCHFTGSYVLFQIYCSWWDMLMCLSNRYLRKTLINANSTRVPRSKLTSTHNLVMEVSIGHLYDLTPDEYSALIFLSLSHRIFSIESTDDRLMIHLRSKWGKLLSIENTAICVTIEIRRYFRSNW